MAEFQPLGVHAFRRQLALAPRFLVAGNFTPLKFPLTTPLPIVPRLDSTLAPQC